MEQSAALAGEVAYQPVVQVKVGRFYEGGAGVLVRSGFSEIAYRGKAPPPRSFPLPITIAGDETTATGMRKSEVKGMTVLLVDWVSPPSRASD